MLTGLIAGGACAQTVVNPVSAFDINVNVKFDNYNPPGPFGEDSVGGGHAGYSPDPAFWGGEFANNVVDPPASAAIFTINPNGSTTIISNATPADVPEPSTVAFAVCGGVAGLLALRRRRQAQPK